MLEKAKDFLKLVIMACALLGLLGFRYGLMLTLIFASIWNFIHFAQQRREKNNGWAAFSFLVGAALLASVAVVYVFK